MAPGDLRINVPTVVHETIDGETIVIHLGTGSYYSLDGVGAAVWTRLEQGLGCAEIVAGVQQGCVADPTQVEAGVTALLEELVAEDLVLADRLATSGGSAAQNGAREATRGREAGDFDAPVLHKYTDMQAFMLVDPIHEVDESAGWPHAKVG